MKDFTFKNSRRDGPTCKELGSHHFHPYTKKKAKEVKLNNLLKISQRTEVAGQNTTLKTGETDRYRELQLTCGRYNLETMLEPASGRNSSSAIN